MRSRLLRRRLAIPFLLAAVGLAGCAVPEEAAEGDVPMGTAAYERVVFDGRAYDCEDAGHADSICRLYLPATDGDGATADGVPEALVQDDGTAILNSRVYVCGDDEAKPHVVSETNGSALDGDVSPGGTSGRCPAWRLAH